MRALSHRFNTYRYTQGQQFLPHLDGDWPGYYVNPKTRNWSTGKQVDRCFRCCYISMAGKREWRVAIPSLDNGAVAQRIKPHCGRALFFRHGIHPKSVLHAGDILGTAR